MLFSVAFLALCAHAAPVSAGPAVRPTDLQPSIDAAAREFGVPAVLLDAIVWEATHFDPNVDTVWHGHGPLDLRDEGGPSIEEAADLLGESPDDLIRSPRENLRGGAALLAAHARMANGGVLPDADDLESWWDAVRVFSGSEDPMMQRMYGEYVFRTIWEGVDARAVTGEHVRFGGIPVDLPSLLGDPIPRLPTSPDYSGAYQYVQAACYSDYSRTGSDISYVVIHTTQGSYSGTISWFENPDSQVSAHYVVRSSDGQITQMVKEADVAWHAGNWDYNVMSIGIEHEGYVDDPGTWYTDAMYKASAALTKDIVARTAVTADRSHIIGHYEVPGATHTDPGSGWDWDYYMSLVTGSSGVSGTMKGVVADSDIYNGARLVGATVWIESTGESTTSDSTGQYTFSDLPAGTYTMHATYPGYQEGTCTKEVTDSSTFWCSIALLPSTDPPDTGNQDTGTPQDTDTDVDTDTDAPAPDGVGGTGDRLLASDARQGCAGGCDHGGGSWTLAFLLLPLAIRRRR